MTYWRAPFGRLNVITFIEVKRGYSEVIELFRILSRTIIQWVPSRTIQWVPSFTILSRTIKFPLNLTISF